MENIRDIIAQELDKIEPEKRSAALIALRREEYEHYTQTVTLERLTAAPDGLVELDRHGQHSYEGLPVIKINSLIEPVVIYMEAQALDCDYLARD